MHISLVIPNLLAGGAERMVLNLAQGLVDRGHRIDIVLIHPWVHWVKEVPVHARLLVVEKARARFSNGNALGLPDGAVQLPAPTDNFTWRQMARAFDWELLRCRPDVKLLRRARVLAAYMARERPDCVLPGLPRAKAATLLAGRFLKKHPPIIPIVHNNYERRRARDRHRLRHLAGQAAHVVGVSKGACDVLVAVLGLAPRNLTTICNPVIGEAQVAAMAELPGHPWLRDDGGVPVVLAAGRLHRVKDHATLIKAFARLASGRPCRLIILGEGRERKKLEALVHRLGLDGRVSLPGWVDNPFAYMSRASLLVVSSIYEGLSMVLVEALACGCPCVSTDCPVGPAEVLQDGRVGPLVSVGDESGLAEAMERVLDRPPDKAMLRRRAQDFSMSTAAAAYEGLIRSVVANGENGSKALADDTGGVLR